MKISNTLYVKTREDWRAWLQAHHQTEREVWFIFYKKHTGQPSVPYDAAVEEALCFGWIDSIIQRLDDDRYAQKFTPRRNTSNWSALNINRVRKLIEAGRMTEAGLATIPPDLLEAAPHQPRQRELPMPSWMAQALMAHPTAWENFNRLAPSYRRQYIGWISAAKRDDTRQRRLQEAIALLERNEKLGMK
jgi:uncharacterized protein YdeI (YjbR/CyaY-like superfamily)